MRATVSIIHLFPATQCCLTREESSDVARCRICLGPHNLQGSATRRICGQSLGSTRASYVSCVPRTQQCVLLRPAEKGWLEPLCTNFQLSVHPVVRFVQSVCIPLTPHTPSLSMIPSPSNPSRPWWSRSSILLKSSSS